MRIGLILAAAVAAASLVGCEGKNMHYTTIGKPDHPMVSDNSDSLKQDKMVAKDDDNAFKNAGEKNGMDDDEADDEEVDD